MPRPMRWCQVFPGQEDQILHVRMFVTQLLDRHPDCEDIVACAAELATNAIRHTASGRNGFFAAEVTWTGRTVRVAVADSGAETVPGLDRLAGLSSSCGSEGDDRGRVVWAQFLPSTDTAPVATSVHWPRSSPPSPTRPTWLSGTAAGTPGSGTGPVNGGRSPSRPPPPRP